MSLLLGLLCVAVFLAIVFWLLGLVVAAIPVGPPGPPAWIRPLLMAVFALAALWWLLGGYSPFWHHRI